MSRLRVHAAAAAVAIMVCATVQGHAQTYHDTSGTIVPGFVPVVPGVGPLFTPSNPGNVTGTFSASLGTFTQAAVGTPINATTSGVTGSLPVAAGSSIVLINKSATYPATCTFGASDAGAAYYVPASQSQEIGIPTGATQITCTGIGGTAAINVVGGAGIFAGAGGGGGSSGGSGAVTQSGTWTVQPGNAANTTPWLVTGTGGTFPVTGTFWQATQPVSGTFWQATQPVSAASLPLPTGAATAALQPTNAAQASATSGQTGTLHMGAVTTAAPSYTSGQTDPLSMTPAGALRVDGGCFQTGDCTPLSPGQHITVASATSLTVPTGAKYATLCARAQAVNFTTDGTTTPTASLGTPISAGLCAPVAGVAVLANLKVIAAAAGGAIDVEYFQ